MPKKPKATQLAKDQQENEANEYQKKIGLLLDEFYDLCTKYNVNYYELLDVVDNLQVQAHGKFIQMYQDVVSELRELKEQQGKTARSLKTK